MRDVAIRVEGLGKMYRIGAQADRTETFREALVAGARGVARNIGLLARGRVEAGGPTEEFWALRDVDFEIKRGEAVGIIGRNGAGKSTLLKVLSRITEPTTGRITLNGRVASLLEVGTGFHPELTGRENIYLNGAIIGMTRAEIRRKFDEIVDFAGVEKFLDTPVKRYSSGMGVRLGFAVAAHLEPEILIVDEVLAVGDAEFQKKCLGKMNEVAGEGRTVLFVSHNMGAVENLCERCVVMRAGRATSHATTEAGISDYLEEVVHCSTISYPADPTRPSIVRVSIDDAALRNGDIDIEIDYEAPEPLIPIPGITILNGHTVPVWGTNARFHPYQFPPLSGRKGRLKVRLPAIPLLPGSYAVSIWLGSWHHDHDVKEEALRFDFRGGARAPNIPPENRIGNLDFHAIWSAAVSD